MENSRNQKVESVQTIPEESKIRTGRPNIDDITKRNEEEIKQDKKSLYKIAGIIALVVAVIIIVIYFFS